MKILHRENLKQQRKRDDRHDLCCEAAKLPTECKIADVVGHEGEAEAAGQHDRKEDLDAIGQLPRRRICTLLRVRMHRERHESRRDAHRRHHQRLIGDVAGCDVSAGLRDPDDVSDDEAVDDTGQREKYRGDRQRNPAYQKCDQPVAIERYRRTAPDR